MLSMSWRPSSLHPTPQQHNSPVKDTGRFAKGWDDVRQSASLWAELSHLEQISAGSEEKGVQVHENDGRNWIDRKVIDSGAFVWPG